MKKVNLLKIITLNEQLFLFVQENLIFIRKKSGNVEKGCLW